MPDGKPHELQAVSFSNINLQSPERTPWFAASFGFKGKCQRMEQCRQRSLSGHAAWVVAQMAQALLQALPSTPVPQLPAEKQH